MSGTLKNFHPGLIVILHIILILLLILIPIFLYLYVDPYYRGFYCDDESIRYPYKKDTVQVRYVLIIGILIPLLVISLTEIFLLRKSLNVKSKRFRKIPLVVVNIYIFCGIFIFGGAYDNFLGTAAKFVIGRPRPHFISACQLDFSRINCSNHNYVMIDNSFCSQKNWFILKNMRLSFPSGHSSLASYFSSAFIKVSKVPSLLSLTIYLMRRWRVPKIFMIFKTFIQIFYIVVAVLCGLSRISDYKHHWSDVLVGLASGTINAILVCYFFNIEPDENFELMENHPNDCEMTFVSKSTKQ